MQNDLLFQGRVPATWNLSLLPPDPTSPGPGGPSPGIVVPSTLAHPLPHYSGAYGAQHSSHYSHLLPQSTENSSPSQWQPPTMEAPPTTSEAASGSSNMHYKMDPDAMSGAMYYPHPVNRCPLFCKIFEPLHNYISFAASDLN